MLKRYRFLQPIAKTDTFAKMENMDKEQLIKFCRFYKGEKECPYNDGQPQNIWMLERFWVERNNGIQQLLNDNLDLYLQVGLANFRITDDTPIMLKSFLFNRFCMERIDVNEFKDWYINVYYGNK